MNIQIDKINNKEKKLLDFSEKYIIPDDYFLDNFDVEARFIGSVSNMSDLYKIEGKLILTLSACCARCLTPVLVPLEIDVLEYFKNDHNSNDFARDVESDEFDINYFNTFEIDTYESLLTNILLHIPNTVYCDEDCKGLCKFCGQPLSTPCECEQPIDPRFASLKSYFDEQ